MFQAKHLLTLGLGAALGVGAMFYASQSPQPAKAGSVDRYQDYIMATGPVSMNARTQLDGVWMLDYRSGKLLGTCIDKTQGKIVGWAEVDLVTEFEVQPRQDVHFMMVTGIISSGHSALYVAETVTGKFGVYTMAGGPNGQGVIVRRHDLSTFRKIADPGVAGPAPSTNVPLPTTPTVPAPGSLTTPGAPGVSGNIEKK
jgi:hypothetical protein